ncbi:MAG TPA: hypothetical protein VET23_08545, partial [Chitinophagaceae bacterium]|nr:hypothetical protein [Chitinophagaceae bacterium]
MKNFRIILLFNFSFLFLDNFSASAQLKWQNVDSIFQPLPKSVHIFYTNTPVDTGAFQAYYLEADLKDKNLDFTVDTTLNRRITPENFYEKNHKPVLVVNCAFFSFASNRSVNVIVKKGNLICFDTSYVKGRGKDSLRHYFALRSSIGFNKKNEADVAWVAADSTMIYPLVSESPKKPLLLEESFPKKPDFMSDIRIREYLKPGRKEEKISKWKMRTVVGGGPALLQNGEVNISNEEEMLFAGKALNDKHP